MLGAIAGDIIGSIYESNPIKSKPAILLSDDCFFTDDTVLTIALADALCNQQDFAMVMRDYFWRYPEAGFGAGFRHWAMTPDAGPYRSWGNGSAMRTSPVAYYVDTFEQVLELAKHYAAVTHNHPEGIKGAQAIAGCIFMARMGEKKHSIRGMVQKQFGYDLDFQLEDIRQEYQFDVSCQGSVPQAIVAFLESENFEDAISLAISLGGDSDTLACMCGGIAEAYYGGVPQSVEAFVLSRLDEHLISVYRQFLSSR